MTRKYIDCREMGGPCTVALSADSDDELMEAAVQHAVKSHGYSDSPELRKQLATMFKAGTPPEQAQKKAA
ncbi:DUF1059 domain-containing protein [Caldimonas sp. KR1-144]|uniref:DUF1059 domain-containing protein n=1 Tax=Caldimonas sp. KR1-144 TaxID=3400911 RepID=UPI003C0AD0DE